MFSKKPPKVLVVGAGPVGLVGALALVQRGVDVRIIDREWRTGAHSYALALHAASLRILDALGLGEAVRAAGRPVTRLGFYDADRRRAEIDLSAEEDRLLVLRQDALESLLEAALRKAGVEVFWNHELVALTPSDDSLQVTVNRRAKESMGYAVAHTEWVVAKTSTFDVPFVLGADGCHSFVRRALQIEFPGIAADEYFAVFECITDSDPGEEMRVMLTDAGIGCVWPLPGRCCRWSFALPHMNAPEMERIKSRTSLQVMDASYPVLEEESLRSLVANRARWFTGSIEGIRWRLAVRFERRLAETFSGGRVRLVGDAAHLTGPVGIQSMNVGLQEVYELTDSLAEALQDQDLFHGLLPKSRVQRDRWFPLLGMGDTVLERTAGADPWLAKYHEHLPVVLPAFGEPWREMLAGLGFAVHSTAMA